VTRLRKMMLEELQRRNYSEITTRKYLQYVTAFARHFGKSPDQLGPNELRSYEAYLLQERKVTPGTAVNWVAALRFFFIKTLKRHQFQEFLPLSQRPPPPTNCAQSRRSRAFDQRRGDTVSTDTADDALWQGIGCDFEQALYAGGKQQIVKQTWVLRGQHIEFVRRLGPPSRWPTFSARRAIASWIGIDPALT